MDRTCGRKTGAARLDKRLRIYIEYKRVLWRTESVCFFLVCGETIHVRVVVDDATVFESVALLANGICDGIDGRGWAGHVV